MATFKHPIAWFMDMLRRWEESERRAVRNELSDADAEADNHHDRNTSFWYFPPPG